MEIKVEKEILENIKQYINKFTDPDDFIIDVTLKEIYNLFKDGKLILNDTKENSNLLNIKEIKITTSKNFNTICIISENKGKIVEQEWKLGKFINTIYFLKKGKNIANIILQDIVGIISGIHGFEKWLKNNNLKVNINKNYKYYYNSSNYSKMDGSLGHSCMNDKLDHIEFYEIFNSLDIISITDNSNKVYGRCLLWKTNKGLYADRSYFIIDILKYGFYVYLEKHYNIKLNYIKDYEVELYVDEKIEIEKLKEYFQKNKNIPYLDTMNAFIIKDNYIILTNNSRIGYYCSNMLQILMYSDLNMTSMFKKKTYSKK